MFSIFTIFNNRCSVKVLWMLLIVFIGSMYIMTQFQPAWGFDLARIEAGDAAGKTGEWIFMDARPLKKYQEEHLPGAVSFSWETYTRTDAGGVKYRTLPPAELAAALGKLGISNTSPVLVYGDADSSWGGEGWAVWVFAWLGHQGPVHYLDGGVQAWQAKQLPMVKTAETARAPVLYQFQVQTQINITTQEILNRQKDITLIDTRNYLTEYLPGHLPGAVHIPWEKFYQGRHRQVISPEALKSLLKKHGVDTQKPVVYYCTGGIRSGFAWMAHQLSGLPGAVNFEGGSEEWNIIQQTRIKH